MQKVSIKDLIMFLKIFGVSSLFFIAWIIICFLWPTKLGIGWPAYVIIGAMINGFGIIVLITKIIEEIKQKSCWIVAKQYNLNANTLESWWAQIIKKEN